MKVRDLIQALEGYKDFEISASFSMCGFSNYGLDIIETPIIGIGDIGHSDKIINLEIDTTNIEDFIKSHTPSK